MAGSIKIIQPNLWRTPKIIKKYQLLFNILEAAEFWKPIDVNLFCPDGNRMQRSWYIDGLKDAFNFKVVVYIYHHGGNIQNSIFVWKVNENSNESEVNNMNYQIRIQLKGQLQIFHTRAMKKEFKNIVELCLKN